MSVKFGARRKREKKELGVNTQREKELRLLGQCKMELSDLWRWNEEQGHAFVQG